MAKKTEEKEKEKQTKSSVNKQLLRQQSIICDNLSFAAAEAYKLLRANLQFTLPKEGCHIIGMTSSLRGEGKSTTAINLAYTLAQAGKRVLLIDADMRLPSVGSRLSLEQTPGLSNLLANLCAPEEALRQTKYFTNWYVMPSGDIPPNPSELLGSERMEELLDSFSQNFDFIILDLPPVGIVSDALAVSTLTDGLLVVVRQNYSNRNALGDCMYQIERFNVKFLGFVMTGVAGGEGAYKRYGRYSKYGKYDRSSYGKGYGYGYGYGYSKSYGYGYGYSKSYGRRSKDGKDGSAFHEATVARKNDASQSGAKDEV
jgi:capsular exopolysaccharide synthesis family protein